MAETAADKAGIPGLIDALAVFIKQEQAKVRSEESISSKCQKKDNSSWARKYPIPIHGSIITWRAKRDDRGQVQYEHQAVRMHLTGKKVKMAGDMTMYGYKNILQGQ